MDFVNQIRKIAGGNEFSEVPAKRSYGYFDNITGNGGGVNVSLNSNGTGFVMNDIWDVQPFKDPLRLPFENKPVLHRISHWMHENHPDFELIDFLGGKPLVLKHSF